VQTVVCDSSIGLVGLVVQTIEDIVEASAVPCETTRCHGVAAALVLEDRVTDVVDIEALISDAGLGQS